MALAAALPALISGASSLIGGIIGQDDAEDAAAQNIYQQRQFAKHGIKWRVKDAINAGIHPLYALGAQTHSFSPVSVGGSPMGEGLAAMGQDVGRALAATMSGPEKVVAAEASRLQLQNMGLQNELLATQISKLRTLGSQPNFPSGSVSGDHTAGTFPGEFIPGTSGIASAQKWQDEYGDIAENIMGSYRWLADTVTQPGVRAELRRMYDHFQNSVVPAIVNPFH